jgi:hypothetical protein
MPDTYSEPLRAELVGQIEATHNRLRQMIEDLEKLDSVIL